MDSTITGSGCLHGFLERSAEDAPTAVAVIDGDRRLTYAEVADGAARVTARLLAAGIVEGDRVGLCLQRSWRLPAAVFGILGAGATVVPVDPEDPAARRQLALEHAEIRSLVSDARIVDAAPASALRIGIDEALEWDGDAPRAPEVDPASLAFIFYTSGSTGEPKGVMLSHRALVSGQCWLQETFPLDQGDRHLLRTTLSVTNLVREIFWPVLGAGSIVVVPPGEHKDPDRLVAMINEHEVATFLVVPALLGGLISNPEFRANRSLKYLFSSSDVMPGDLPGRYFATGLKASLYNLYGLTEALYASYWQCEPGETYQGFVPVGYPAELEPVIVDEQLEAVPDGTVGELCLRGVGIADGYFKQEELSASRFVRTETGALYRTGDLARRAADGRLDLLGRIDDQIKVAGYRVEIGEVENAMARVAGIAEAAAAGRETAEGHRRLVAYLVAEEGARLSATEIRAGLTELLPEHMIPAAFVAVEQLPLTHNAKVDRRALAGLGGTQLELEENYVEPRPGVETRLAGIWARTLGLPRVGRHDNFFALGGDSIQGFLIGAEVHRAGGHISATQVFLTPTVAEMAEAVEGDLTDGPGEQAGPDHLQLDEAEWEAIRREAPDPEAIDRAYPLTAMQEGMLFHSLLDPDAGVYVEQFLYEIDDDLDPSDFEHAWRQVVSRHEILRVWIAREGLRRPVQVSHSDPPLEFNYLDLEGSAEEEQGARIEALLAEDRRRGFDYREPPLFRVHLFRLGSSRLKLLLSYHHLILDAWSLFVLLGDSLEAYRALREDRPARLSPAHTFGDYVAALDREDHDASREYWQRRLAGFHRPTVIGNRDRIGLSASSIDLHSEARLCLGTELTEALHAYGRRHRFTLNSMVQAAWAIVVSRFSKRADVCFGITITHRPVTLPEIQDRVGIFINTLPMRLLASPSLGLTEWVDLVQRIQVEARAHESYPLPLIQQRAEVAGDQPLFETLLIFENFPRGDALAGTDIALNQERYIGYTNYPFAIEAMPEDELFFQVKYDEDFFDPDLVETILSAYREVLAAIAAGAAVAIGDLTGVAEGPTEADAIVPESTRGQARQPAPESRAVADTDAERALQAIWSDVLGVEEPDVETDFLALGGTSLLAMQIIGLAEADGFEFELKHLFGSEGNIRRLAAIGDLAESAAG